MTNTLLTFHVPFLLIIGLITTLTSCSPIDYVGRYELRHFPKTSIELKNEGTFEFIKINPNPYLHSFDHPEDYYFITNGTWTISKDRLLLNSFKDSLIVRKPEIIEMREDFGKVDTVMWTGHKVSLSYSTFTFYDIFGDTVDILSGQFPNGSSIFRFHRQMRFLNWPIDSSAIDDFHLSDTIEFHFYGYRPYEFIRTDKVRRIVRIKLYPDRVGGIFKVRQLAITRKRIKDGKMKFDKKTNAQQR